MKKKTIIIIISIILVLIVLFVLGVNYSYDKFVPDKGCCSCCDDNEKICIAQCCPCAKTLFAKIKAIQENISGYSLGL